MVTPRRVRPRRAAPAPGRAGPGPRPPRSRAGAPPRRWSAPGDSRARPVPADARANRRSPRAGPRDQDRRPSGDRSPTPARRRSGRAGVGGPRTVGARRHAMRDPEQPARDRPGPSDRPRPAGQDEEDGLEGVLRVVIVMKDAPADPQHHRAVPDHQLLEGRVRGLVATRGEPVQELRVGHHPDRAQVEQPMQRARHHRSVSRRVGLSNLTECLGQPVGRARSTIGWAQAARTGQGARPAGQPDLRGAPGILPVVPDRGETLTRNPAIILRRYPFTGRR